MKKYRINFIARNDNTSGGGVDNNTGPHAGDDKEKKHKLKGSDETDDQDAGKGSGAGNAGNAAKAGGLGGGNTGGMEGSHLTGGFEGDGPPEGKS
ncbi:hypothetical protein [Adhaeribacter rhizoryzae]|uniref:Uncharacterized protein n=1 Tax=Adhaeribacter rhizoryzae TaxID=2607907 RepID=A0A5M6D4B7_9BACT|nr:hypothetical protein [Adhaeribacter rhizoryzae]KAA5540589.1 hypothetical protein F0145_22510 [Adhaeribacter rhizoryzae]